MANTPLFNLSGKYVKSTFQNLVQLNTASDTLTNGLGNSIDELNVTASYALSASWAPQAEYINSFSGPISASWVSASVKITTSDTASYVQGQAVGISGTYPLAWLTYGGVTGSITVTNGMITAITSGT
jgi:hypothetical protein